MNLFSSYCYFLVLLAHAQENGGGVFLMCRLKQSSWRNWWGMPKWDPEWSRHRATSQSPVPRHSGIRGISEWGRTEGGPELVGQTMAAMPIIPVISEWALCWAQARHRAQSFYALFMWIAIFMNQLYNWRFNKWASFYSGSLGHLPKVTYLGMVLLRFKSILSSWRVWLLSHHASASWVRWCPCQRAERQNYIEVN